MSKLKFGEYAFVWNGNNNKIKKKRIWIGNLNGKHHAVNADFEDEFMGGSQYYVKQYDHAEPIKIVIDWGKVPIGTIILKSGYLSPLKFIAYQPDRHQQLIFIDKDDDEITQVAIENMILDETYIIPDAWHKDE